MRETFEETGLALGLQAPATNGRLRPEWQAFHATGLAPALDKLDYIYRAVTPPGLPRRFNARFFLARADDASGTLGGNGELLDLGWVPVTEAMGLPIPYITAVVLEELEHVYASPPIPIATGRCRSASASAATTSTATNRASPSLTDSRQAAIAARRSCGALAEAPAAGRLP